MVMFCKNTWFYTVQNKKSWDANLYVRTITDLPRCDEETSGLGTAKRLLWQQEANSDNERNLETED